MKRKRTIGRIGARFTLSASGFANVDIKRSVTLPVIDNAIDAAEVQLSEQMEEEFEALQEIGALIFLILQWKQGIEANCGLLEERNISLRIDVGAEELQLMVEFVAEYAVASIPPVIHRVKFKIDEDVPSGEEVIERLQQEWATLKKLLTIGGIDEGEVATRQIPRPFLLTDLWQKQKASRDARNVELMARAATPEEATECTQRYLHHFHFPFEIEEDGVRYSFVPRVELDENRDSMKLIMTVGIRSNSGENSFVNGGSKEVAIPLDEIYVKGDELNRKTQEGILELVKGLCRTLGKESGLNRQIDISRPH